MYLGMGTILLVSYLKKDYIKNETINLGWNIVYFYHLSKNYFTGLLSNINKNEEKELKEEKDHILIMYDGKNGERAETVKKNEKNFSRFINKADLVYLFNYEYMKQLRDDDDYKIIPSNIFFMNVEFVQDNQKIDIKKHLHAYYVVGNKLFTKIFLKWYLMRYYGIKLGENYEINILDIDINFLNIRNGEQYIKIISEEEYKVINI